MKSYRTFSPKQRTAALRWFRSEQNAGRRLTAAQIGRCDACGQERGFLMEHSEDYSEPFGDHIGRYTLCYTCHMMIHCRDGAKQQWDDYRDIIRAGGIFAPYARASFGAFASAFIRGPIRAVPNFPNPPVEETLLDRIEAGAA